MTKPPERVRTGADLDADALTATDCRCRHDAVGSVRGLEANASSTKAPATIS